MKCKNCEQPLLQENNYCNHCGAKVIKNRLTLRNVGEEFANIFLNVDNTILKTFVHMLTKPHVVVGDYISGVRKRYLNVISFFTIALTLSGFQVFVIRRFYPEAMNFNIANQSMPNAFNLDWIFDFQSLLSLIALPLYAIIAQITFLGLKKFNFTEHLVIMTYITAEFTMINVLIGLPLILSGVNFFYLSYPLLLISFLYTAYSYKKLYNLSLGNIFARSVLCAIIIFVFYIIAIFAFVAVLFLTADKETIEELGKAGQGMF